jgi:hypothetical protein
MDTVVGKKSPLPDRYRLMTAFLDAVEFIKTFEEDDVLERMEAIKSLVDAREIMEKHPAMQNFGVTPFFRSLELSPEQTEYLLQGLVRERITMCAQLLARDTNVLENILLGRKEAEAIPYPLALQALHYGYHHFQEFTHEE